MSQRLFTALLAASVCAGASADPMPMRPGLWEITTETSMPGMPVQVPPQTMRHCYTAQDLDQTQKAIPPSGDGDCQMSDYVLKDNTATWTMRCTGQVSMEGRGSMTMEATRYSGEMTLQMQGPGGPMAMTNRWRATRLGDCR